MQLLKSVPKIIENSIDEDSNIACLAFKPLLAVGFSIYLFLITILFNNFTKKINKMPEINWKPDFYKWYNVNKECYKFIFEQAEKRLEDILSESESITNKSIKMATAIVAMFAFFIGFIIQKSIQIGYNSIFIGLFIINVSVIVYLIFPKDVKFRGLTPQILIPSKLDADEDKEFQIEMLYYSAIRLLQDNIDFMLDKNSFRAKVYLVSLIMCLFLFVVGTISITLSL